MPGFACVFKPPHLQSLPILLLVAIVIHQEGISEGSTKPHLYHGAHFLPFAI